VAFPDAPDAMLYKRPGSPFWWVRFTLAGREVRCSTRTADRRLAEEYERRQRETAWRRSELGERVHTWNDATARWFKETQKRSVKRDKEICAWFDQYLAGENLADVDRASVQKLRGYLLEDKGPSTANRYLGFLRALLRAAVSWGLMDVAPPVPAFDVERTEPAHASQAQFDAILAELPEHLKAPARFAVLTGLRLSNTVGLKWADVHGAVVTIPAKRAKGRRTLSVPISAAAHAILEAERGKHAVYVFTFKGKPFRDPKTAWRKAVKRAGMEGFRWHDLRHTWASWHTQSGTPPIVLKELGGWSSLAMVEKYSHLNPDHLAEWVDPDKNRHR
jgi:integrase